MSPLSTISNPQAVGRGRAKPEKVIKARMPRANHFTVYPGDPTEVIVYKLLDGPGGAERGKMPIVQGTLEQVLIYMRGEAG